MSGLNVSRPEILSRVNIACKYCVLSLLRCSPELSLMTRDLIVQLNVKRRTSLVSGVALNSDIRRKNQTLEQLTYLFLQVKQKKKYY